jgi:hypothetical protein
MAADGLEYVTGRLFLEGKDEIFTKYNAYLFQFNTAELSVKEHLRQYAKYNAAYFFHFWAFVPVEDILHYQLMHIIVCA